MRSWSALTRRTAAVSGCPAGWLEMEDAMMYPAWGTCIVRLLLVHYRYTYSVRKQGSIPVEKIVASLTQEQVAWLKSEAARLGITVSELLRRLIDQVRGVQWTA